VIEDSFTGFCAAQAAGIATVVIAEDSQHARFQAAVAAIKPYLNCWKRLRGASGGGISQPFVGADIPGM
jgi:beta-phosphoglucomutase-like phosphatase (HAD superfamily)